MVYKIKIKNLPQERKHAIQSKFKLKMEQEPPSSLKNSSKYLNYKTLWLMMIVSRLSKRTIPMILISQPTLQIHKFSNLLKDTKII